MARGLTLQKGFLRNHQLVREHFEYNTHSSSSKLDGNKAFKHKPVHKKIGWSGGLNAKQFDVSRRNYSKHFHSRKSIPDIICLPHICWGFGHHGELGGITKFFYK